MGFPNAMCEMHHKVFAFLDLDSVEDYVLVYESFWICCPSAAYMAK